MTATTLSLNSTTNTNAGFRAWGSGISAAFATVGLVKTTDTGQIDWATVAAPPTASTSQGYEVWRFNDTLQATKPIYLKVEYGTGATTASPEMWATVGTGTDGAGTLTSQAGTGTSVTSRRFVGDAGTALTPVTGAVYVAAPDASCVGMLAWPGASSAWGGMMFAVERTRDPDGTPNSDGFLLIQAYATTTSGAAAYDQRHFSAVASPGSVALPVPGVLSPSFQSVSDGTTLYPIPVFTGFTWRMGGPSKLLVAIGKGDVPANQTFTMTQYGAAHPFVSAGGGSTQSGGWGGWTNGGSGTSAGLGSFAMRMD